MHTDEVDLILVAGAEVDPADILIRRAGRYRVERIGIRTGIGCRNIRFHQIGGNRIESAYGYLARSKAVLERCDARGAARNTDGCGNDVVREAGSGVVSGKLGRGENSNVAAGLWNRLSRALISEEEEELIFQDRSTNRAAEDVLVEYRRRQSDGVLLEEVASIQERIAVKLKHIAVK